MRRFGSLALSSIWKRRIANSDISISAVTDEGKALCCRSFASGVGDGQDTGASRLWQTLSEAMQTADKGNKRNLKDSGNAVEQSEFKKDANSRWFWKKQGDSPGEDEGKERQEMTIKQIGARWLASSREQASADTNSSDLSSIPWFGSTGENQASERERLEVSLQRLALMSKLGNNSNDTSFMFLPPKDNLLRKYFHWDNLSSAEKHKIELAKVRREFRIHPHDCGSSQVQIALLTNKIKYMTKHMETHRKDVHSRKGLEAMVSQRRKLLKYLRRKDWDSYCDVIIKLNLRDNVMDKAARR